MASSTASAPAPAPASASAALLRPLDGWPRPRWAAKWRALVWGAGRMRLGTLTEQLAEVYGERPALLLEEPLAAPWHAGSRLAHADLARLSHAAARGLAALGVAPGERVGLLTRNRVEVVCAEFGAARLGAVVVPLNALLTAPELRTLAADCALRTLVIDRELYAETFGGSPRALPGVERWIVVGRGAPPPGTYALDELLAASGPAPAPHPRRPDELAAIFYTSGTTGRPKGAMLPEGALLFAVRQQARQAGWLPSRRDDLALLVMPLAHTSGHQALLLQLVMGTPMLLHARFVAERVLEAIERHRVTQLSGVPAMFRMLLDAGAERVDLGSLDTLAWGGDAMPEEVRARFDALVRRTRRRPPRWVTGYGLAETAGQLTRAIGGPFGPGLAGRPLRGVRVRVLDADGRPVRRGQVGELWVRSPGQMLGYWRDEEATRGVLRDGWLRTGDLVRRGRSRRLWLASRAKEMIKVGGYSVYPAEIEAVLRAHPDVEQAVVVGVPHAVKGSVPAAAVVARPGAARDEAALLAWARARLAPYKAPRHVVFVEAIPLSSALKPQRARVAAELAARLSGAARSEPPSC
ncbi:MAG TPA: class I adenylate-forming enzyme family protein [Myxococcota bacterium]